MYPIGKKPPLWTMNLHPVIKDENADGSLPIEGTVHQGINHKPRSATIMLSIMISSKSWRPFSFCACLHINSEICSFVNFILSLCFRVWAP